MCINDLNSKVHLVCFQSFQLSVVFSEWSWPNGILDMMYTMY